MIERVYTKDEIKGANVKTVRRIASDLKIKNITSYSKEELVEKILDAQQSLINAGIVRVPMSKPEVEPEVVKPEAKTEAKPEVKQEVLKPEIKSEENTQKIEPIQEKEQEQEQLNLDLESVSVPKEKKKASKPKPEKPKLSEEELKEQRRKSLEKRRKEMGYVPPEDKTPKQEVGGEHLTSFMNIAVPIALLVAIYCGLETIIFVLSKLWYGDLAYVPVNLVLKVILFVISMIIIEVAKYTQKFDKVIDHYANKLKNKQ